jgi:NAD(P)H-hydrate epimerase
MNQEIKKYLDKIELPKADSHKGQNGKLLIIGGSELFHAASRWSLDVASKFVDMVFYSSVPENNQSIQEAKGEFWNGIVVPKGEINNYADEADCILIGPGMMRDEQTKVFVDSLIAKYSNKKMVIDAGALQVVDSKLININHILTPHAGEMTRLKESFEAAGEGGGDAIGSGVINSGATILLKGEVDKVSSQDLEQTIEIEGGNVGMTKGGSGDSLAGLVAALYCSHDKHTSAVVGSYINKKAGDELYKTVGPYFNTSDLVAKVPEVFWKEIKQNLSLQ